MESLMKQVKQSEEGLAYYVCITIGGVIGFSVFWYIFPILVLIIYENS